nr:hypothetical protein [uncultured Lichenicoccus sp.]
MSEQTFAGIADAEYKRRHNRALATLRVKLIRMSDKRLLSYTRKVLASTAAPYHVLAVQSGLPSTTLNNMARGIQQRLHDDTRERLVRFVAELEHQHALAEP